MAITLTNIECDDVADVETLLSAAEAHVDVDDFRSLELVGKPMFALQNNRTFLAEYFNAEIKKVNTRRLAQYLSPQSFVFGASSTGRFAVRCNIWVRPEGSQEKKAMESRIFSYGLPHSHNFSFLTVGYLGAGYGSRIYEVDPVGVQGHIGEKVSLTFLEQTRLPRGKGMIYRSGLDVHTQLPPDELSISLNLLVSSPRNSSTPQYYVDVCSGTIIGFPEVNGASKRLTLLTLAKRIGNDNTIDVLNGILKTTDCFRTRIGAASAIKSLLPPSDVDAFLGSLPFAPDSIDVSIGAGLGRDESYGRSVV